MGKFDTHGGRFSPPGYMKVNEGGSHGENPNGGVQIGTDGQGIPNMLEEGEPVYRDFVYSDRIRVDRRLCRKFSIPEKYAGKLYSDVADGILGEAEERSLDPVSRNGLDTMLGRLADMQEEQKARTESRKVDSGMDAMSDDDLAAMEQSLAQGAADEAMQQQAADEAAAADAAVQEAAAQDTAAQQVAGTQEATAEGAQVMKRGGVISRKAEKQADAVAQEVLRRNEADERARYGLRDFEDFARDADGNIIYGDDGNPVIITGEQGLTPEDWKFAAAIAGGAGLGNGAVRAAAGRVLDTIGRVYGIADAADKAGKAARGELTTSDLGNLALDAALMVPAIRGAVAYGRTAGNAAELGISADKARKIAEIKNTAKTAEANAKKKARDEIAALKKSKEKPPKVSREEAYKARVEKRVQELLDKKMDAELNDPSLAVDANGRRVSADVVQSKAQKIRDKYASKEEHDKVLEQAMIDSQDIGGKSLGDLSRFGRIRRYWTDPTYGKRFHANDWRGFHKAAQGTLAGTVDANAAGAAGYGAVKAVGSYNGRHTGRSIDTTSDKYSGISFSYADGGRLKDSGQPVNRFGKGSGDGTFKWNPDLGQSTLYPGKPLYWDGLSYMYGTAHSPLTRGMAYDYRLGNRPAISLFPSSRTGRTGNGGGSGLWRSGGVNSSEYMKAQQEIGQSIDDYTHADFRTPLEKPSWQSRRKAEWLGAPKAGSDEALAGFGDDAGKGGQSGGGVTYPVWPRYAGAVAAGIEGLYNAFQQPDRYDIPHVRPVLPTGSLSLENPEYVPVDESQALAQLSAGTAASLRSARNSGLGPSAGATIAALDSGYGRNAGSLAGQIWDVNAQRRNAVTAQRNANAQQEAQFRYNVDSARAQAINNARLQNIQNDLYRQRLNNVAEGEKYAALRSSIDAVSQALAGIGQENFYLNQLNGDSSYDYIMGHLGRTHYAPKGNTEEV